MKRLLAGLVFLLLAACQDSLTADVTRFNTLPAQPSGQSFSILPDKGQAGSLEFQQYADLVASALQARGFRPIPHEGPPADLVVMLNYGNAGRRTEVYTTPAPAMGGWYGGPGWWGWNTYYPLYGSDVNSYTLYSQFLEVDMFDGPAFRSGQRRMVFQGRAVSESDIRDVNVAMPYLVRALFLDFPGANGKTVRVSIPIT